MRANQSTRIGDGWKFGLFHPPFGCVQNLDPWADADIRYYIHEYTQQYFTTDENFIPARRADKILWILV